MGNFANSLHVRSDDPRRVADVTEELLLAAGYAPTDAEPDDVDVWGFSPFRGLKVAAPHHGWVGILDTDLMAGASLAEELSRRLGTAALQLAINNSSTWYYMLYQAGHQSDAFDSSGEALDSTRSDELELALPFDPLPFTDLPPELQNQVHDLQQRLAELAPPEMRAIQQKMESGEATPYEIGQFMQWAQPEMRSLIERLSRIGLSKQARRKRRTRPHSKETLQAHAQKLQPLLKPGASEQRLADILGRRVMFAEENVREFLDLLGIPAFYALLSYRYSTEHNETDLATHNVIFQHHLRFEANP